MFFYVPNIFPNVYNWIMEEQKRKSKKLFAE